MATWVRMSVAAVRIESNNNLGLHTSNDSNQLAHNLFRIRLGKGVRMFVVLGTVHTRVAIAEKNDLRYSQRLSCAAHFSLAHLPEIVRLGQSGVRDLSHLTSCRTDKHHAYPFGRRTTRGLLQFQRTRRPGEQREQEAFVYSLCFSSLLVLIEPFRAKR